MLLVMEENKPLDPMHIRLLGPQTIVPHPDRLPHLVKQCRLAFLRTVSYPDALVRRLLPGRYYPSFTI
jgi:hypothetical protein